MFITRAAAVPLVTFDPYFSLWCKADRLTDAPVYHWTDRALPLDGTLTVGEKTYRFMGASDLPAMEQVSCDVTATSTTYRFEAIKGGEVIKTLTKTPMTNIKMYTELMSEEVSSLQKNTDNDAVNASLNRIQKYATEIRRQNERLEFLIDSLTKLSRLESGTLEVVADQAGVYGLIRRRYHLLLPVMKVIPQLWLLLI